MMSGFAILSSSQGSTPGATDDSLHRVITAYERKNLKLTSHTNHNGYTLLLFANEHHDPHVALSTSDTGTFCTYVGTLVYRGQTAKEATARILSSLNRGDSNCLDEILGNFCLIIGDSDGLRVVTDRAGLNHAYYTQGLTFVGNSFIAASQFLPTRSLLEHEMLQYILYGATFGTQTLLRDIFLLEPNCEIRLQRGRRLVQDRGTLWQNPNATDPTLGVDEQLSAVIETTDIYYRQLGTAFGSNVTAALSGGYDSRLNLALLRRNDIVPKLFVYGASNDPDVQIAKLICLGEGLELHHIAREISTLDPGAYWSNQEMVFHGLDGLTQYGFACSPDEIQHRRERVDGGLLAINGGGGEIWRDYWKLPAKPLRMEQFIRVSYASNFRQIVKGCYSEKDFYQGLARRALDSIEKPDLTLSISEIQSLYPRFRLRYWQGKNNSVDNTVGHAITPFSEHHFSVPAAKIPISAKREGWFERQLIIRVGNALASYPSAYGYDFLSGPPMRKILFNRTKYSLPLSLRAALRSVQRGQKMPYYLSTEFLDARFGQGRFEIERFLYLDKIRDPLILSRALTVERMLRDDWI